MKNFQSLCLILFLSVSCTFLTEPSGVLLDEDITPSIKNYIRNNISDEIVDEGLLAYFDATISLDKSQLYFLTNKTLVIYCKDFEDSDIDGVFDCIGTTPHGTNIIPLKNINKIYETDEYFDGTSCRPFVELCFYVNTQSNDDYFFSTPWFNNGDLFYNKLIVAWEAETRY